MLIKANHCCEDICMIYKYNIAVQLISQLINKIVLDIIN